MSDGSFRSELFALADAFIERSAALDPIAATDYGIDRYDDMLTDFSLAHSSERTDLVRSTLASLAGLVPSDDVDRIGKDVMVERLTASLGLEESGERRRIFSVLSSPASQIRQVFAIQRASSPEDAEKIRSRLDAVRSSLDSWRGALDEDSRRGLAAARRQPLGVADQLDTYAQGSFRAVAQRVASSCQVDVESSGLAAAASDADEACGQMATWLRDVYVPRATAVDAVGAERYGP